MKKLILLMVTLLLSQAVVTRANERLPFFWGSANAAYQVEGSPEPSDWNTWSHTKDKIKDATTAEVATDSWHRYEEDFKLAQDLGSNAFRLSLAWERIEPERGHWNLAALQKYAEIIQSVRRHGMEPIVTLHHFVLPLWLSEKGGVLAPDFVEAFTEYAVKVVSVLSAKPTSVRYWMTFNEPNILASQGYVFGTWPPGIKGDWNRSIKALGQEAKAHIQAVQTLRALNLPDGSALKFSVAYHWRPVQPATSSWTDQKASRFIDRVLNRIFMTAVTRGELCFDLYSLKCERHPNAHFKSTLDYLGINYYGRETVNFMWKAPFVNANPGSGPTDLGWEIYPQGLYDTLKDVAQYHLPILISENGIADHTDHLRPAYIEDHIKALLKAKAEGVPVMGYLHWSLTDNYEWAEGLVPRFGLVAIDYADLSRHPRDSYFRYKAIIESHPLMQ